MFPIANNTKVIAEMNRENNQYIAVQVIFLSVKKSTFLITHCEQLLTRLCTGI